MVADRGKGGTKAAGDEAPREQALASTLEPIDRSTEQISQPRGRTTEAVVVLGAVRWPQANQTGLQDLRYQYREELSKTERSPVTYFCLIDACRFPDEHVHPADPVILSKILLSKQEI